MVTEFMKRVHLKWPYGRDMLFLDFTGNFDQQQYRVLVLLTHSFSGAFPLGKIVTSTEKPEAVGFCST